MPPTLIPNQAAGWQIMARSAARLRDVREAVRRADSELVASVPVSRISPDDAPEGNALEKLANVEVQLPIEPR